MFRLTAWKTFLGFKYKIKVYKRIPNMMIGQQIGNSLFTYGYTNYAIEPEEEVNEPNN